MIRPTTPRRSETLSMSPGHGYLENARGVTHYTTSGRGPCVVLCHALGTDASLWSAVVEVLEASHTVITFDLRGHGESSAALDRQYSFDALAGDIRDLLAHLGVQQTSLIGISVGGEIAQVFAARYPARVTRLLLCSTACVTEPARAALWEQRIAEVGTQGMSAIAAASVARWFTSDFRSRHEQTVAEFRERLSRMQPEVYISIARTIQQMDLRPLIGTIRCPTLVVYGDLDANTGEAAAATIVGSIPGARLEVVHGAAHFPHLELPDQFNASLSFLSQSSGALTSDGSAQ